MGLQSGRAGRVLLAVALLVGCEGRIDGGDPLSTIEQRLELPPASTDNIFTRAIAQKPLGKGWVMVPAADFARAVGSRTSEDPWSLNEALAAGEIANDAWTSGVASRAVVARQTVESSLWLVVDDAVSYEGFVLGTRFTLVPLSLRFTPSWSATDVSFTLEAASVGTGRCCGPAQVCDVEGPMPPACPREGRCGDGMVMAGPTGASEARTQAGFERRGVTWYSAGKPGVGYCHPRVVPGCANATPMCSGDRLGVNVSQTWEASLPVSSASCSSGSRPVSGRNPPRECLYAAAVGCMGPGCGAPTGSAVAGGVARGGSRRPACDGRCLSCEDSNTWTDSNLRPRQCDIARPAGGFGLPAVVGAGVCEGSSTSVAVTQAALAVSVGWTPGSPPMTGA